MPSLVLKVFGRQQVAFVRLWMLFLLLFSRVSCWAVRKVDWREEDCRTRWITTTPTRLFWFQNFEFFFFRVEGWLVGPVYICRSAMLLTYLRRLGIAMLLLYSWYYALFLSALEKLPKRRKIPFRSRDLFHGWEIVYADAVSVVPSPPP